jgi:hypothetical protein
VLRIAERESLWVLTEQTGVPTLVLFRERGAGPAEEDERLTVMLVRGAAPVADLLFVADRGKHVFTAYSRPQPLVALDPSAAVAEMARLLEAGQHVEFLREWVLPEDLEKMQRRGRTLEAAATEFGARKAKRVLEALRVASKLSPSIDATTGDASFTGEGLERPLLLQPLGRRWFLRN